MILMLMGLAPALAQVSSDSTHTPDHWIAVDLKEWAWYLNFTRQQKQAIQAIDARYVDKENALIGPTDYVDTEDQRTRRKALAEEGTAEVRAALDPPRFSRWLFIRNGGRPMKPPPLGSGNTRVRTGIGIF